jgi:hypothetical protein
MSFTATHRPASCTMHVAAPPADVFPLLCPVRERDWIPGWDADVLHSRSGLAELGCVFVTRPGEGRRLAWVVTRYEPPHAIAFAIFHRDVVETLLVELAPAENGTGLVWSRAYTALEPSGNDWIEANVPAKVEARLAALEGLLRSYFERSRSRSGTSAS